MDLPSSKVRDRVEKRELALSSDESTAIFTVATGRLRKQDPRREALPVCCAVGDRNDFDDRRTRPKSRRESRRSVASEEQDERERSDDRSGHDAIVGTARNGRPVTLSTWPTRAARCKAPRPRGSRGLGVRRSAWSTAADTPSRPESRHRRGRLRRDRRARRRLRGPPGSTSRFLGRTRPGAA